MEEKSRTSSADVANVGDNVEERGWVSPDVLAAEAGETVEMGKTVDFEEE